MVDFETMLEAYLDCRKTKAEHSRRYGVRAELCSQLSRTDKRS